MVYTQARTHVQLNIKGANQFLELNNILLFLTCVSKYIILIQNMLLKNDHIYNQPTSDWIA